MENPQGTFHDTLINKTITRDLTADEIAALPTPTDEAPPTVE
jgi:hypothetical protein